MAFVLDCEEQYLTQRLLARGAETGRADDNEQAVAQRIHFFKDKTLPVIKALDDMGKLAVVGIVIMICVHEGGEGQKNRNHNLLVLSELIIRHTRIKDAP